MTQTPRIPGIYALRHKATGLIYIGSSINLSRRKRRWFQDLNAQNTTLPLRLRELGGDRNDWEFSVLKLLPFATHDELIALETRAIAHARRAAAAKILNAVQATTRASPGISVGGEVRSLREWQAVTGVPKETIRTRLKVGWTPREALGYDNYTSKAADYAAVRARKHFFAQSAVVVYDGDTPLSRSQAASRLGCRPDSLRERLRRYRMPGFQGQVQLSELKALSDKYRRNLLQNP